MIHHLVLFKLKPEAATPSTLDFLLRQTRMRLLRIPVVKGLRCGKHIDPHNEWSFFYCVELEHIGKLEAFREHDHFIRYQEEAVKPLVLRQAALNYESDPGSGLRYG